MADKAPPPSSAQATTSSNNKNENPQNSKTNKRGSGNKHRGNQRSYSQNRSRNDSSQDEGYYSRGAQSHSRGGKQGPRDDQRMSRQDQENEWKGNNNRRGRGAYSSDRNRQGYSTDRNVATHSRDRSLQPLPSTSFSGAQDVFDLINDESSKTNKDTPKKTHEPSNTNKNTPKKTHAGSNKNLGPREGNVEHEKILNKNQKFNNSSDNIHKKRDSESTVKKNPNQKFDGNRGHQGNNQSNDRLTRPTRNDNAQQFQGPQRKPPNKRGPNNSVGIKVPYKVSKFNNEHYLRENQILNTVQTESHPELFSYEDLARELNENKPAPVLKENKNTINHTVEKRKKAGKLINSIKKSDDSQGNIPNEFKRRRKPGRLTLLNRIRKGQPVDSDDDEQDYVQVENKRKKASEKKKKVLELLMSRRSLHNDADSSDDNAISIEHNTVKDQNMTAKEVSIENENTVKDQMKSKEVSIEQSPIHIIVSVDNTVNLNIVETTDISMKESPVCNIQNNTNKQDNKVISMTDSSDDSDENAEFDKRNQRKFDAFKLSNNLSSHLAKHKLGQTNTVDTIETQKDKVKSNDCKTENVASVKDLKLSHLKEIIEARRKNESRIEREENKQVEEIEDQMKELNLKDNKRDNMKTNVESNDKSIKQNNTEQSEKRLPNNEDKGNSLSIFETVDEQTVENATNKFDDKSLSTPKLSGASVVEESKKYTESKTVTSQMSEITPAVDSNDTKEKRDDESNSPKDNQVNQEVPKDNKTDYEEDEMKEDDVDEEEEEEETDESDEDIQTKLIRAMQEKLLLSDKPDQVMEYLQQQLKQAKEATSLSQPSTDIHQEMIYVQAQCGEDIRVDEASAISVNKEDNIIADTNDNSDNFVTIIRDGTKAECGEDIRIDEASVTTVNKEHIIADTQAQCGEDIRADEASATEVNKEHIIADTKDKSDNFVTIIRDGTSFSIPSPTISPLPPHPLSLPNENQDVTPSNYTIDYGTEEDDDKVEFQHGARNDVPKSKVDDVIVCDSSSDDDDYDDDDEDDDDGFPVIIAK